MKHRRFEFPDATPFGVGVDAELDRFARFGRIVFCFGFHGCRDRGFHTRLTTPCHLTIFDVGSACVKQAWE